MQNDTKAAIYLFKGTNVNILDAVRILRGALDLKPGNCTDDNLSYLMKVVNLGISAVKRGIKSKPIFEAYQAYLEEKSSNLKPTSLRDIKTIANRIFRKNPTLKERFAGDISSEEWLKILNCQFPLPNQFNKARAMLHALYSFCLKMRWSEENPVSPIPKKKIFEKEIAPLSVDKVQKLLTVGKTKKHSESAADAEVENADPNHEHDVLAVFAQREGADEDYEQNQHHRHRLLVADLVVLPSISSTSLIPPASPRRDDTRRCTPRTPIPPARGTYRP